MKHINKPVVLSLALLSVTAMVQAQDTTRKRSVEITSAFKPVLRESAKINFNATPPQPDTSKPVLQYNVPNQHLLFAYQPGALTPLALQHDTAGVWDNSNYIKAGFGSLKTPYLQAGLSFGDGSTAGAEIFAKYTSSKGKREYQENANAQARVSAFYKTAGGLEWSGGLGFKADRLYKYGYVPETLSFPKDSIRQQFSTFSGRIMLRNLRETNFALSYAPELKIDVFSDHLKNSESNTVLTLPLEKNINSDFAVNLGLAFDMTRLSRDKQKAINNTIFYVAPGITYKSEKFVAQVGIRPSWDNSEFKMFPNILAEYAIADKQFVVHGGWTGYMRKTSYQYLASQNPWIWAPGELKNTWIEEVFGGIKGTLVDHFTYNARVGVNKLNNQPLFINDTSAGIFSDGKSFAVLNQDKMNIIVMGGELGYTVEEKFSATAGITLNQFTKLKGNNQKAWGMLPMEMNANIRAQIIKDLWLKVDMFGWDGAHFIRPDGSTTKLKGAFDLNAGLEFKVWNNISLWTQFNNIANQEYQRWNQYPVYGFNFVGGIVYSFAKKNK